MKIQIYAATIIHRHGASFFLDIDAGGRTKQIADWCREYWSQEGMKGPPPDSDEEVIELYFGMVDDESLYLANEPETVEV